MFKSDGISWVRDVRTCDRGCSTWPAAAVLRPLQGGRGCRVPPSLQGREEVGMTAQVSVQVVFPDGSSQRWATGTQVIVADGVEPMSVTMLGGIVGMLTAAGIFIPRDDDAVCFESMLSRDALAGALLNTLAFIEAEQSRIVGGAG